MSIELSNVIMIDRRLMPSCNKAFTLAEVLITLSILGVVAAITVPALISYQSDKAARTRIKKAIANYEKMMGIYLVENNLSSTPTDFTCENLGTYFKIVKSNVNNDACSFTTSDGVLWQFTNGTGQVTVASSENDPKYSVDMAVSNKGIINESGYDITRKEGVIVPSDATHAFASTTAFWQFIKTKEGNGGNNNNNSTLS